MPPAVTMYCAHTWWKIVISSHLWFKEDDDGYYYGTTTITSGHGIIKFHESAAICGCRKKYHKDGDCKQNTPTHAVVVDIKRRSSSGVRLFLLIRTKHKLSANMIVESLYIIYAQ